MPVRKQGTVNEKYRYQDEEVPPPEHISPQVTNEVLGPELVHVSEKNLRGGNTSSSHGSVGPKQKHWAKKGSSDELQAEPEPSRWQQIVAFFTRRHSFIDCISVATSSTQ
ncbi:hypothetical protein A6R68_21075, partial [Neotoma lepida]